MKNYIAIACVAATAAFAGVGCQTDEMDEPAGAESDSSTMQGSGTQGAEMESGAQSDAEWNRATGGRGRQRLGSGASGTSGSGDSSGGSGGASQP